MQRGRERVVVRYPLIALVDQGRLTQREAAEEMGVSVRQVRRLVKQYRDSGGRLGSLAYQRRHPAPNALPARLRQEIRRLHREYSHWSCPAVAETLAATEGVETHNAQHVNRDTGCTPQERLAPSAARPPAGSPDDIFCLKEERKVAKDHTISLDGVTYTLPSEPCLVAFRVQLHIHPGERLRVWHGGQLVAELPHVDKARLRDAPLKADQVVEDILAATQQKCLQASRGTLLHCFRNGARRGTAARAAAGRSVRWYAPGAAMHGLAGREPGRRSLSGGRWRA